MRSHCAIYVDVGYLLASAATRVTGTSLRRGVLVDHPELISGLIERAEADSGLPLLRVNWYDSGSRPGGMPDFVQDEIGLLPRVKLRLGRLSHTGEQKGVDLRIGLDLATHGRNRVVDVIYLVSGDDDLTEAVEEAQGHGVQVILLAVPGQDQRPHGVARHLQRASDGLILLDGDLIDHAVRSRAIPEALVPGEHRGDDTVDAPRTADGDDGTGDVGSAEPDREQPDTSEPDPAPAVTPELDTPELDTPELDTLERPVEAGARKPGTPDAPATGEGADDAGHPLTEDSENRADPDSDSPAEDQPPGGAAGTLDTQTPLPGAGTESGEAQRSDPDDGDRDTHDTRGGPGEDNGPEHGASERPHTSEHSGAPGPTPSLFARKRATTLVAPPDPVRSTSTGASGAGSSSEAGVDPEVIDMVARQVVRSWCTTATPAMLAELKEQKPSIPGDLDRALLVDLSNRSGHYDIDELSRHELRHRFWQLVEQVRLS